MSLFATPDFGTGGMLALFVLGVYGVAFLLAVLAFRHGSWLREKGPPEERRRGLALMLAGALPLLCCCLVPAPLHRLTHGHFPIGGQAGRVTSGMTAQEVLALLGRPWARDERDDGEWWYYHADSFGIHWVCIHFDAEGRVTGQHGN